MSLAPYHHSYKRLRADEATLATPRPNPAADLTDQGAEPEPADLAWSICHAWRVVYYAYREAAGLPLWDGVEKFEIVMAGILFRLSRDFEPIEPIPRPQPDTPPVGPVDPREDRVYQPSCRVYPDPVF